jgi:hypothetical protein
MIQGLNVDVNWGAMTEEEKRRALLNDELVQVVEREQKKSPTIEPYYKNRWWRESRKRTLL